MVNIRKKTQTEEDKQAEEGGQVEASKSLSKSKLAAFRTQRKNANAHTFRGKSLLLKSMNEDGWIGAMTVAADGETFDGSARLEKAQKVFKDADPIIIDTDGTRPVIVRRTDIQSADDPKARKLAIAANRVAQLDLNWDADILKQEIELGEIDLLDVGFSESELGQIIDLETNETEDDGLYDEPDNTRQPDGNMFPVALVLNINERKAWDRFKEDNQFKKDKDAFLELLKIAGYMEDNKEGS